MVQKVPDFEVSIVELELNSEVMVVAKHDLIEFKINHCFPFQNSMKFLKVKEQAVNYVEVVNMAINESEQVEFVIIELEDDWITTIIDFDTSFLVDCQHKESIIIDLIVNTTNMNIDFDSFLLVKHNHFDFDRHKVPHLPSPHHSHLHHLSLPAHKHSISMVTTNNRSAIHLAKIA